MSTAAGEPPTYIACLTPPGRAAIAVLALRGPRAWEAARALFRSYSGSSSSLPERPEPGRFWLGKLGAEAADEVVLAVKRAGPVPWLEIHCHGGPEVIRLLIEAFQTRGVQACSWQDLDRLTAADPTRPSVLNELVKAPTLRTAAILLDQLQGALHEALGKIRAALNRQDRDQALVLLDELARYAPVGRHLTVPWRVAVVGAPNVGKSSLVNALAGFQRSLVAATPGTTRDVVTTRIAIDGWPVELADTAGLRGQAGPLESQGMDLARSAAAVADLSLWVLDASAPPPTLGHGLPTVPPEILLDTMHFVINKTDLPPAWDLGQAAELLRVSALTGAGLPELCRLLAEWLVPDPPPAGAAVPFTETLCNGVEAARRHARAGQLVEALRFLDAEP